MRSSDFDIYASILQQKSGLALTPDKAYLIESRLNPVAKKWNFDSLDGLTRALQGVPQPDLVKDVVEAMTTNETSFFRDTRPFDLFKGQILPFFKEHRKTARKLRIWCAACSSGQEPYSLAMILDQMKNELPGWSVEIVATDIDHKILDAGRRAVYSQFEVQRGMPIKMLMDYFEQKDDGWHLKDLIKNKVQFKYFNLLDGMSLLGKFDIIFCRNVLIYFDRQNKKETLEKMRAQLVDDGFLFLGGSETIIGITDAYQVHKDLRGIYLPPAHPMLNQQTKTLAG